MGCLSAVLYGVAGVWLPATNRPRDVAAFLAVFGALFVLMALATAAGRRGGTAATAGTTLLGFALLFRLLLVPAGLPVGATTPFGPPVPLSVAERASGIAGDLGDDLTGRRVTFAKHLLYDDDLWRYLWDGRVTASGDDPYLRSPGEIIDRETAPLPEPWPDVVDRIGFPTYRTVYPPGAQLLFLLAHTLAPASVVVWKLLLMVADLATCALVLRLLVHLGRPPWEAALYAWNPLVIKEIAGSGHVDGLMVLLAVLAVERVVTARGGASGRRSLAGLSALAASATVKLGSVALAPALLRATRPRTWWIFPVVGVLICLPFAPGLPELARSLGVFGGEWVFNGGPHRLLAWLIGPGSAGAICGALLLAIVAATAWRVRPDNASPEPLLTAAFAALAAAAWLSPAVMPWYLVWALPFAVLTGRRSWVLLSALSLLSYLVYATHAERAWWLWLEHGGFVVALAWEEGRRLVRFRADS